MDTFKFDDYINNIVEMIIDDVDAEFPAEDFVTDIIDRYTENNPEENYADMGNADIKKTFKQVYADTLFSIDRFVTDYIFEVINNDFSFPTKFRAIMAMALTANYDVETKDELAELIQVKIENKLYGGNNLELHIYDEVLPLIKN